MYTQLVVLFGSVILGVLSGVIGVYALLKNEGLLSDAIGHSSLFGICLAYILFRTKNINILMFGALISGILIIFNMYKVSKKSIVNKDSSMTILLSFYFGLGLVLLSYISNLNLGNYSGLTRYIFGQASTILIGEVYTIAIISFIILIILFFFSKEFQISVFDRDYAKTIKINEKFFNSILSIFVVIVSILGLQIAGAVLISSFIIIPSTIAKIYTSNFKYVVLLSGLFGGISGFIGVHISSLFSRVPTGPTIALTLCMIFIVTYFINRKRV